MLSGGSSHDEAVDMVSHDAPNASDAVAILHSDTRQQLQREDNGVRLRVRQVSGADQLCDKKPKCLDTAPQFETKLG